MNIGILTSSRADYGIYLPLIKKLKQNAFFDVRMIVFGTHLSELHGATYKQIEADGFKIDFKLETVPDDDSPVAIALSIGDTVKKFAQFWNDHKEEFDLIFCLGDRYEMFAAVTAGIPFQVPFAHFHGGETTLGAIDNVFRHSITMASKYHFASTEGNVDRIQELIESDTNVYNVGALSLDNLGSMDLLTIENFNKKWGIDLSLPTILTTFHPETIAVEENQGYCFELIEAIKDLESYQVLVTMPNADTSGLILRQMLTKAFTGSSRVFMVENLGSQSYFTAMKFCSFMLGNTSSGIIEAASYGKYVIDLGDRQKGRVAGENVIHIPIDAEIIKSTVKILETLPPLSRENIYYNGGAADKVIDILHAHKQI